MARFHLITETDARTLERGSTVHLAPGGHVTPLALDTLRERRVRVIRDDDVDTEPDAVPAVARPRSVAVAGETGARPLVAAVLAHLRSLGLAAHDLDGPGDRTYVDAAAAVARAVRDGEAEAGIAIDASGFGSAVAAGKVRGVRAAMCASPAHASLARAEAGVNVLGLGSEVVTPDEARAIVSAFVGAAMRDPGRRRLLGDVARLDRERSEP